MARLETLARIIRSKNATPFYLTLDLFFESKDSYTRVKNSKALNKEIISTLYKVPLNFVKDIFFIDSVLAVKIVMLKRTPSGDPGFLDIYGMQQNIPLLGVEIP
ncbi:MAG: DUF4387 domain-containing protein [Betaproteobacteria bacterium]